MSPAVQTKVSPLHVRKDYCYVVVMRNMKPGAQHGEWQPITTSGFVVVCPSKLEACELVFMVGGRHFNRPFEMSEEQYLEWLLKNHFRIEPYKAGSKPLEVMFSEFVRGWFPSAEDLLHPRGTITAEHRDERHYNYRESKYAPLVKGALDSRWG